jgi:hypothetical protein
MEVYGTIAGFFGVKVNFPHLAKGIGFYEMAFVVHMKAVVYRVTFHMRHEAGNIDERHSTS